MITTLKALETTATIDDHHILVLDEPIPDIGSTRVRIIVLLSDEDQEGERDWLKASANNPAFSFLHEPEEDIYTASDGIAFNDKT